jgi:hypothetical protein
MPAPTLSQAVGFHLADSGERAWEDLKAPGGHGAGQRGLPKPHKWLARHSELPLEGRERLFPSYKDWMQWDSLPRKGAAQALANLGR